MNGHSKYTMFNALKDNQFQLALSVLVKIFDDQRTPAQIRSVERDTQNESWQCDLSPRELAALRWDTTCAIEGVILKLFKEEFIQKFRNSMVEVAHFIEKKIFYQASSSNEYGRRDTLLYRMKRCSRGHAEQIVRQSRSLERYLPLLLDSRKQRRPKRVRVIGASAA